MILLDTDHLSLLQARNAPVAFVLQTRLEAFPPDEVVTTVITMEEQMRGWLALIHRATDAQRQVAYFERLRQQRVRIGTMDLKIAAIALGHNALVLSGNLRDFQQVPGLNVEDWRQ